MGLSPEQRSRNARIAAHAMHAKHDARLTTAAGRKKFLESFEEKVDPDETLDPRERACRAEHARKAYFQRLAKKSVAARRARSRMESGR
jgi:hypothetical protein